MAEGSRHPLWDLPVRVFHWGVAALVVAAWASAELGRFDAHQWIGYSILVLVAFRLVWGLVGSRHARFTDFLVGPRRVMAYLRGHGAESAGHNPLGGWSVMVILLLLTLQGVSGLFNTDDALYQGPFYYGADTGLRDTMGVIHEVAFNVLLGMLALHIAAVSYHQFRLREPLVQAMLRGSAPGRTGTSAPAPLWLALLIVVLAGLLLWWVLGQAPQPDPGRWG